MTTGRRRLLDVVSKWRHTALLTAVFCMMTVFPLAGTLRELAYPEFFRAAIGILFDLALVVALALVSPPRHRVPTLAIAAIAIVLHLVRSFSESHLVTILWHVTHIAVLVYVIARLGISLFRITRFNADAIAASLCTYLFIGLAWALAYSFLETLQSGSFQFNIDPISGTPRMQFTPDTAIYPIYYSIITMTTLGYGDIVPASNAARSLASAQALIGQIYIAVIVARLVSLQVSPPVHPTAPASSVDQDL